MLGKVRRMIDGTYKIKVDIPFGRKDGTVVLHTQGNVVAADIDAPIVGRQHVEGLAEGDTFTAQSTGKIKMFGTIEYALKGEVAGDTLHLVIQSNKGAFALEGVRA